MWKLRLPEVARLLFLNNKRDKSTRLWLTHRMEATLGDAIETNAGLELEYRASALKLEDEFIKKIDVAIWVQHTRIYFGIVQASYGF